MLGFLNIDKPAGLTSRDVVNRVQAKTGGARCGHAGTLDPLATGVLVVAIGRATRLVEYVQQQRKAYRAKFELGLTSDTEDVTGRVTPVPVPRVVSREEVCSRLTDFTGQLWQRPPDFSALKVRGQRAYQLARQGRQVELAPRRIEVHRLDLMGFDYPHLELMVTCSAGTYIRSLGRDIARACGTDAVMVALQRLAVGNFTIAEAVALDDLEREGIESRMLDPKRAVEHLPYVTVGPEQLKKLGCGQPIELSFAAEAGVSLVAAVDSEQTFRAILGRRDDNRWWPVKNIV